MNLGIRGGVGGCTGTAGGASLGPLGRAWLGGRWSQITPPTYHPLCPQCPQFPRGTSNGQGPLWSRSHKGGEPEPPVGLPEGLLPGEELVWEAERGGPLREVPLYISGPLHPQEELQLLILSPPPDLQALGFDPFSGALSHDPFLLPPSPLTC